MIQEILDYLLIRSFLINNSQDEIVAAVTGEEEFSYLLNNIYDLMQEENYILVSLELCDRVSAFINAYRFDYIKNKDYCEKMNYIIGRLHEHSLMSEKRKIDIANNWINEESSVRNLPRQYRNVRDIFNLVSLDMAYFKGMITIEEEFEIHNIIEYSSLVNIIINKFPLSLENDEFLLGVIRDTLIELRKIPLLRFEEAKMLKNTLNKLNQTYDMSQIPNIEMEVSFVKKKTKK